MASSVRRPRSPHAAVGRQAGSHDKAGNETAGNVSVERARTNGVWSDHSQQTSVTVAGKTYAGLYGSTDQSERLFHGDTTLHNGPLGLSGKTDPTGGMGFNREPTGTLNSMTTGGKSYYYLTDALGSVLAMADETGTRVNRLGIEGWVGRGVAPSDLRGGARLLSSGAIRCNHPASPTVCVAC